ncbi:MAG: hypothetical protein IKS32_00880 [Solobacterium sp.]|nr:hypothetical protein [Solobacterium sp.]
MKTRDQIMYDLMDDIRTGDVFTTEEFAELMKPDPDDPDNHEIEFVDSFGYFHDGEELTDVSVDPYTFDKYKDRYPYVIWYRV